MASPTQRTWVWVDSGSWWWTGRPGVLRFMGLQRIGHDWATELNWTEAQAKWLSQLLSGLGTPPHAPPPPSLYRSDCVTVYMHILVLAVSTSLPVFSLETVQLQPWFGTSCFSMCDSRPSFVSLCRLSRLVLPWAILGNELFLHSWILEIISQLCQIETFNHM